MEVIGLIRRLYCILFRYKKTKREWELTEKMNVDVNTVFVDGERHLCYLGYGYWTELDD